MTGAGSQPRVLVIGSQCRELNHLSFLPAVAEELYAVLTTPDFGGCVPALPDSVGLLLDPTAVETREALETAFERASIDEATRPLVYIGHGGYGRGTDFYLLLLDASACPNSTRAASVARMERSLRSAIGVPAPLAQLKVSFPTPCDAVTYIMDTFPIVRCKYEEPHQARHP